MSATSTNSPSRISVDLKPAEASYEGRPALLGVAGLSWRPGARLTIPALVLSQPMVLTEEDTLQWIRFWQSQALLTAAAIIGALVDDLSDREVQAFAIRCVEEIRKVAPMLTLNGEVKK